MLGPAFHRAPTRKAEFQRRLVSYHYNQEPWTDRVAKGSVASSSRVGKYLLFLLLAVLCALGLEHYFTAAIGHDQVSYLIEARRWMSGNQLYGPFLSETNPPVIIWISAVPVALARWAHLSEIACLKGLTLLCIIASVVSCYRIASRTPILSHPLAKMGMGFAVLALDFALTPSDFSQREHLLVILLTPYLLAVATGVADQLSIAENVALGLMAAVGIWLKPHDVLVPFGLQLFRCARARSFACLVSRSFLSLLASCISLLGCVLVFAPLYFKQTVPILLDTYWGIGSMTAPSVATRLNQPFKLLPPATVARLAALQRTDSAEDLDHWQPAVVLIPTCNPANPCFALNQISFAMLPWFLRGSDFAAAWSHYRKRPLRVENYDVYERVL